MKTEQAILDQIKWLHTNAVQGKTHPDALTGYAVAMEVDTGNVVAGNLRKNGWKKYKP